jgi:hypothetical protein
MQARIGGCGPLKILESYSEFPGKERETKTRKKERGGKNQNHVWKTIF